jgi:O-antigen/teichoic acid export membrane protein
LRIGELLRLTLGQVRSADHRHQRIIGIVQGVVTGLASRGVGILVSLLSVPLTIGYLGTERYGIWALVGSILAWLRLADIGIGNGLNNAIAHAIGHDRPELVRAHISTALAILSAIAVGLGAIAVVAWPWIDWNTLFNVKSQIARAEVGPAMAMAFIIFLLGFPLSVTGRVYIASQEGRLANYWGAAGNIAGLLALLVVTQTRGGLVWLVFAVSGANLLVSGLLSGLWLFLRHRPALAPRLSGVSRESARQVLHVGVQFFLIQIMALIVFETDNLVIAHYLGASRVPPYSLTYSLFNLTTMIQAQLFNYVWIAYSDALARRDIVWVRRGFSLNVIFSLGFTLAALIPLVALARPFIGVWAGRAVVPPFDLVMWMAVWSMINAYCSPVACLFAAAAHLKAQLIYSFFGAVANVALSIYLVRIWGITGAIAGTCIAYLIFICLPATADMTLLMRKLRDAV